MNIRQHRPAVLLAVALMLGTSVAVWADACQAPYLGTTSSGGACVSGSCTQPAEIAPPGGYCQGTSDSNCGVGTTTDTVPLWVGSNGLPCNTPLIGDCTDFFTKNGFPFFLTQPLTMQYGYAYGFRECD